MITRRIRAGKKTGPKNKHTSKRSLPPSVELVSPIIHCFLCGKNTADGVLYRHYLEKIEGHKSLVALHPQTPFLCESCACDRARHGRNACVVWAGAKCLLSDGILIIDTTLY